jgi:hypothetical protein
MRLLSVWPFAYLLLIGLECFFGLFCINCPIFNCRLKNNLSKVGEKEKSHTLFKGMASNDFFMF